MRQDYIKFKAFVWTFIQSIKSAGLLLMAMAAICMFNSVMFPLSSILLRNMIDHVASIYATGVWRGEFVWMACIYVALFLLQNTIPFSNAFVYFRTQLKSLGRKTGILHLAPPGLYAKCGCKMGA